MGRIETRLEALERQAMPKAPPVILVTPCAHCGALVPLPEPTPTPCGGHPPIPDSTTIIVRFAPPVTR